MELDVPQRLEALRQHNQTLLDKLRSRQSTMKTLLGSMSFGSYDNTDSSNNITSFCEPQSEVEVTTAEPVNFPPARFDSQTSAKIHIHSRSSDDSDLMVTDLSREETRPSVPSFGLNEKTRQSILKRRKIIDDNVRVGTGQSNIPALDSQRNLNFSYSDEEDIDMLKKVIRNQLEIDMALEHGGRPREDDAAARARTREVEELLRQRRLQDSGNDRQHSAIIRELSARPKSVIFDETAPQGREKFDNTSHSMRASSVASQRGGERPLLGYDFIAGLLDNESMLVDKSDAFYDELNEFRRVNKDECTGKAPIENVLDLTRPISPEIRDPGHTCVHGYNVNERLYPEPLNEDPDGRSMCPVCLTSRREPTDENPGYVRVSIPRSTLQAPYKVKPHRRRSFDDTDNFALGKHCLAGWECSKPSMLPTASTVDLKQAADGLRAKLTTTIQDIEAMTESYKRVARPDTLLDTSRTLRAEAQYHAMNRTNPLHSTAY